MVYTAKRSLRQELEMYTGFDNMKFNGNQNDVSSGQQLKPKSSSRAWEMNWSLFYFRDIHRRERENWVAAGRRERDFRKEKQNETLLGWKRNQRRKEQLKTGWKRDKGGPIRSKKERGEKHTWKVYAWKRAETFQLRSKRKGREGRCHYGYFCTASVRKCEPFRATPRSSIYWTDTPWRPAVFHNSAGLDWVTYWTFFCHDHRCLCEAAGEGLFCRTFL